MVMSTAFIGAVQRVYPGAQIDVIVKKELSGIAELIDGLHTIHAFSKSANEGLLGVFNFGRKLRSEKYDFFFCLPDSLSSALMGWATGSKKRIGFSKEGRFLLMTNSFQKPKQVHRVEEYVSLLTQYTGKPADKLRVRIDAGVVKKNNLVIINFNSEAVSRRMPVDKAKSIIHHLMNAFPNRQFGFVGAPKDQDYVNGLIADAHPDRITDYTGKTDLKGLTALLAGATAVLTTDSGPAHLANSTGVPVVALFGAGNEFNTAPYNKQQLSVIRAGQLPCEPCVSNTCKLYGIPKCMELLDETRIINALSVFLQDA